MSGVSNKKAGLGSIRPRHASEAVRDLRFGLVGQSLAPLRSPAPFVGTDAGDGERLPARHPRYEIHKDHYAARRGLSLSVHAAVVRRATAKLTETITSERWENAA